MYHRIFFGLAISLLLCSVIAPARAQWIPTSGPNGGTIWTIASNGTNLYAGTTNGLFVSIDNGITWKLSGNGLVNPDIRSFAAIDTDLFVGTDGSGVFRSTDNGTNWVSASKGLPLIIGVSCFAAISTGSPLPVIFIATDSGVYRSLNNGTSWALSGLYSYDIATFSVIGTNIIAGDGIGDSHGGGAFLSKDLGITWTRAGLDTLGVSSFVLIGASPLTSTIFAGTYLGGAFYATLSDTNWTQINTGLLDAATQPNITSLAINGTTIYAGASAGGVVVSSNNGALWDPITLNAGLPLGMVSALAVNNGFLFAAMDTTIWRRPIP